MDEYNSVVSDEEEEKVEEVIVDGEQVGDTRKDLVFSSKNAFLCE